MTAGITGTLTAVTKANIDSYVYRIIDSCAYRKIESGITGTLTAVTTANIEICVYRNCRTDNRIIDSCNYSEH